MIFIFFFSFFSYFIFLPSLLEFLTCDNYKFVTYLFRTIMLNFFLSSEGKSVLTYGIKFYPFSPQNAKKNSLNEHQCNILALPIYSHTHNQLKSSLKLWTAISCEIIIMFIYQKTLGFPIFRIICSMSLGAWKHAGLFGNYVNIQKFARAKELPRHDKKIKKPKIFFQRSSIF